MKPFNDQFSPTGLEARLDELFGFSTGNVAAKERPNELQEALSEHGMPK